MGAAESQDTAVDIEPAPEAARDVAQFGAALRALKVWAGNPSLNVLARRSGVPRSTLADALGSARRTLPRLEVVLALVRACGAAEPARWGQAWKAIQNREEGGGVRSASTEVPAQLPAAVADFTGRQSQLAALNNALKGRAAAGVAVLSGVSGAGGIGKTAFAVHAAHRLSRSFPGGTLYLDLHGTRGVPVEPAEALARFLRSLGTPAQEVPDSEDERGALFRTLVADRRVLIVLDDARDAAQVRPVLPGAAGSLTVVTSRTRLPGLDGVLRIDLDVLDLDESLALFRAIVGADRVEADPRAADEVLGYCAGLPLAIRIAASRLACEPAYTLRMMADALAERRSRLDELTIEDRSVRAAFQLSYDRLPAPAAAAFRTLALWNGPSIGLAPAAALLNLSEHEALKRIAALVDVRLVEATADGYRFHDLIASFAREPAHAQDSAEDDRRAIRRLLDWYAHAAGAAMDAIAPQRRPVHLSAADLPCAVPVFADSPAGFAWCDRERSNLVAATRLAHEQGADDIAWRLPVSLQYYYQLRFLIDDFIVTQTLGAEAARRDGSAEGEARALLGLTAAYRLSNRFDEAAQVGLHMIELFRADKDGAGEAAAISTIALIYMDSEDYPEAIAWFSQGLALEDIAKNRYLMASMLNNIGVCYRSMNKIADARASYERALGLYADDPDNDAQAYLLKSLGALLTEEGEPALGVAHLERSIRMHLAAGRHLYVASAYEDLGHAQTAMGDREAARASWRRACQIYEEHNHPQAAEIRALFEQDGSE